MSLRLFVILLLVQLVSSKLRVKRQEDPLWHMDKGMQMIGHGLAQMLTGQHPPADLYSTQHEPYTTQTMSPVQRYMNNFQNPFDFPQLYQFRF